MAAKGICLVALTCCLILTVRGQTTGDADVNAAASVLADPSPASVPDSAVYEPATQMSTFSPQAEQTVAEVLVPISSHPPRLYPLVSPLKAVEPDVGAMSADLGAMAATPAPLKGVFLTRKQYGSARQAARAAPIPPAQALAAAAAAIDATAEPAPAIQAEAATVDATADAVAESEAARAPAPKRSPSPQPPASSPSPRPPSPSPSPRPPSPSPSPRPPSPSPSPPPPSPSPAPLCTSTNGATYKPPTGGCGVGIDYHTSSPVMRTLKLVPIFYGNWNAAQKTLVTTFLSGLGGSSWMGINNLYSDNTGPIANATGLYTGQSYTFPTTSSGTTLSDAQVQSLVQQGISNMGSAAATDTLYMLLTGPDIGQASTGAAFCTDYCGWHTYYYQSGAYIKYLWAGNAITQCPGSCIPSQLTATNSPSGDKGIDGLLSVVAHEITESATDPLINAWYKDSDGNENADICAWQFGTIYTNGAGKKYNVRDFNGNYYLLQTNFNPKTGACVTGV